MTKQAHQIDYKIHGDDLQAVEIILDPNESVRSEIGSMLFYEDGIAMETSTGGGLLKGLGRMISGENFFISTFTNSSENKKSVTFAAPYPGQIVPLNLAEVGPFLCQKDSYLCSASGIDVSIAFTKRIGAGFFGGEGFILQKLSGDGFAFVHGGGTIIERTLTEGETLMIDSGCLVAFSESVQYDITMIGGVKNILFGGEGLFMTKMTGPGKVIIQTLPLSRIAGRIISASGVSSSGISFG